MPQHDFAGLERRIRQNDLLMRWFEFAEKTLPENPNRVWHTDWKHPPTNEDQVGKDLRRLIFETLSYLTEELVP